MCAKKLKQQKIKCYYQNVRGIRTKLPILLTSAATISSDIFILTETWLDPGINSAELGFPNFNIYRMDRNSKTSAKKRGGGVAIAISKSLSSSKISTKNPFIEQLFVNVKTSSGKIIVGCAYLPPNSDVQSYSNHCDEVESICAKYPNTKLLLVGDYNLPHYDWCNMNSVNVCSNVNIRVIRDMALFLGLTQCNSVHNIGGRTLDLALSNVSDICVVRSSEILLPVDVYHPPLEICMSNLKPISVVKKVAETRNFKKADYDKISNFLKQIDWSFFDSDDDINVHLKIFYSIVNSAIEQFVPLTTYRETQYPKWFSKELINLIYLKKVSHKRFKQSRLAIDYTAFQKLRADCNKLSAKCYKTYISAVEGSIMDDSNFFWKYVKSQKENGTYIPSIMSFDSKLSQNLQETVNLFADCFSAVYTTASDDSNISCIDLVETLDITDCNVTIDDIVSKLKSLDSRKSAGPDNVPPRFLVNCMHTLSYPIHKLFTKSLSSGVFPDLWKFSLLMPIFKKGNKSEVTNYRPICIMSTLPKLFESLVLDKLISRINRTISPLQHGFIKGRSTLSNLILYTNDIVNALNASHQTDSIYTDFSKAFDKVNHKILIHKLKMLGIRGIMLEWFKSYLLGRYLAVKIDSFTSYTFAASSGVPQGSHLGPILFCLFINDIVNIFSNVKVLLFADDLKIYRTIKDDDDRAILQSNLIKLCTWCSVNDLQLNTGKCQIISFYKGKNPLNFSYFMNDANLLRVSQIRDLGIIFHESLQFNIHIDEITSDAMRILGFILRIGANFNSLSTLKHLYCSLVRSRLEYNSTVWSPYYNVHSQSLEKVQNKFLRYVNFKMKIPIELINYNNLLAETKLLKLSDRRVLIDLLFLFKIIKSLIDSPNLLELICINIPARQTRSKVTFNFNKNLNTNYSIFSPIPRIHNLANKYCELIDIFSVDNFASFKRQLISILSANNLLLQL